MIEVSVRPSYPPHHGQVIGSLNRVHKRYGKHLALDGLSFSLHAGEVVALLGLNGAGKTTTVRMLLGLSSPTSGEVRLFNGRPGEHAVRKRMAAMLQGGGAPSDLKVREHIRLFSSYYPNPLSFEVTVELAGLNGLEDRLYGNLSGGQKQRVMFALAVCGNPDLLILDEPTAALDLESRRALWEQIKMLPRLGKTVLLTTHHLEEADMLADRVVVLQKGKAIAEGSPDELKRTQATRRIRCRTSLSLHTLQTLPTVVSVLQEGELAVLATTDADLVMRALLKQDDQVKDLEVQSVALEDAFWAITEAQKQNC
jgi:ABC-2 type transport system ATP-binding protein